MTELNADAPPPTLAAPPPSKARGPLFWMLACCGGCALFALIPIVLVIVVAVKFRNAYVDSMDPQVQAKTYDAVVPNVGPPPGFRILVANSVPIFGSPIVVFVAEHVKGRVFDILFESPATVAILTRTRESESERENRKQLFESPTAQSVHDIPFFTTQNVRDVKTGTIPGHVFPLRYVTATLVDPRGDSRQSAAIAIVDLTPEDSRDAIILVIRAPSMDTVTHEFLVDFCKNFKPGE